MSKEDCVSNYLWKNLWNFNIDVIIIILFWGGEGMEGFFLLKASSTSFVSRQKCVDPGRKSPPCRLWFRSSDSRRVYHRGQNGNKGVHCTWGMKKKILFSMRQTYINANPRKNNNYYFWISWGTICEGRVETMVGALVFHQCGNLNCFPFWTWCNIWQEFVSCQLNRLSFN